MADFCTIMTVVPTGGIDWSALLGSGATEWWAFADEDDPAVLVAVAAAVADDAAEVAAGPEPLLAAGAPEPEPAAVFEPDDPPHAASSSTSDPSPVAAAHPLLRIRVSNFARMARSPGTRSGLPGASRVLNAPGRPVAGPGKLEPPA